MDAEHLPILAVDIDDTLADYVSAFLPWLNALTPGVKEIQREDIKVSFTAMGIPPERFGQFYASGALSLLKPVPGARDGIERLAKHFEIEAVTSRPDGLRRATRHWLRERFPDIGNVHHTHDKGAVCKAIGAFGLVDDVSTFATQVENSYVIDAPWNRDNWTGKRGDWDTVATMVLADLLIARN